MNFRVKYVGHRKFSDNLLPGEWTFATDNYLVLRVPYSAQLCEGERRDLDVTIEPVQTREERLREARHQGLKKVQDAIALAIQHGGSCQMILDTIERVDAEFAKGEGG